VSQRHRREAAPGSRRAAVFLLFFLSGFTGLVYEVLWLKDLSLLFGNAAHATATTLSVFFLGLALGGWIWGSYATRIENPLRAYGFLEIGIGAAGLLYFLLLDLYRWLYDPLYALLGERFMLLVGAKVLLSALLLLPPAVLMGGTFPVLGELLVRRPGELGRVGSLLYGTNTVGAALGALTAGFLLPPFLGFRNAYLVAVVLSVGVGSAAWMLARRGAERAEETGTGEGVDPPGGSRDDEPRRRRRGRPRDGSTGTLRSLPWAVALASGVFTLGFEVVWTRMFAQVLQNSVYTFSTILVVFLVSLAGGSFLANRLCRLPWDPAKVLTGLLLAAGLAAGAVPDLFHAATGGLGYLGAGRSWGGYLVTVFLTAGLLLLPSGVLLGTIFPYLLRVQEESRPGSPGRTIGRLTALNTVGGIVGSLVAGFVLLATLGLWGTSLVLAVGYVLLGGATACVTGAKHRLPLLAAAGGIGLLLLGPLDPTDLTLLRSATAEEEVLDIRQGSHGVTAVVRRSGGLRIKVNNFYSLGGTASADNERNQALLPLMTHRDPDSVFFLGMGTGITAGASLALPVEHVTVTELVPEVIEAARAHFGEWTGGLFRDPRVRILARDGRNYLAGTSERYDAIISDLFIPWKAGSGSLYTLEHFRAGRERLRPGGIFVQWIPLYQVTREEFYLIARTFLQAFPQARVWRGDFFAEKPILALVGSVDAPTLDPRVVVERGRALGGGRPLPGYVYTAVTLPFYAGNLGRAPEVIPDGPLNTDDRPILEYGAPIAHRRARTGETNWFVGEELLSFYEALHASVPPEEDPYLARLEPETRSYVRAGLAYHRASILRNVGRLAEADASFRTFLETLPIDFRPETRGEEAYSSFAEEEEGG